MIGLVGTGARWLWAVCLGLVLALLVGGASSASAQTDPDPSRDPNAQALADKYAPIMYLAIQSGPCDKKGEAYYPAPVEMVLGNEQIGLMDGEEGTGLGCDDTSRQARRVELTPILVPTDIDDQDDPLAWSAFEGRWGEREGGIWNGPTGPNTKDRWNEPLTWEDGLREFSYSVGENNPGGLSPVHLFCNIISFGGAALNLNATHPVPFRLAVGAVLPGVVALFYRDRKLLVGAGRIYFRHLPAFAVLGLLIVPVALLANGIQALLTFAPPVDYLLKLAEKSPSSWVLYLLAASGLVYAPVLIAIGPAVIEAVLRRNRAGRPGSSTVVASCWRGSSCWRSRSLAYGCRSSPWSSPSSDCRGPSAGRSIGRSSSR